jgi:hypothetical protein
MATAAIQYAASAALTITLNGLATSVGNVAGQESTAVDNTSNLYIDAILGGTITLHASTAVVANTQIEVWVYGSYDGTNYSGGATGSNAALTPVQSSKTYMKLGAILPITATTANISHKFTIGSVANLFGGVLPSKWGVWVSQSSGQTLHASNNEIEYIGVKYTSA